VDLDPNVADALAVGACVVAVLALLLAVAAWRRLSAMRKDYAVLQGADGSTASFVEAVARKTEEVERLRGQVAAVSSRLDRTQADVADSIRHVAVVRFDAFGDMGGRLSFAVALLDDAGDGLIVTSINGRAETRTYAKGVKAGASDQTLSPEEEQAIGFAMRGGSR
jgi:hypothetical protein